MKKGSIQTAFKDNFPYLHLSGKVIEYDNLPICILTFIENLDLTCNKFFRKIKVKKFVLKSISISLFKGEIRVSIYFKIHKDFGKETYHLYRISDHINVFAGKGCVGETISENGDLSEQTPIFDLDFHKNKASY